MITIFSLASHLTFAFFLILNTFSDVMELTFIKVKQYRISKREIEERLIENYCILCGSFGYLACRELTEILEKFLPK